MRASMVRCPLTGPLNRVFGTGFASDGSDGLRTTDLTTPPGDGSAGTAERTALTGRRRLLTAARASRPSPVGVSLGCQGPRCAGIGASADVACVAVNNSA